VTASSVRFGKPRVGHSQKLLVMQASSQLINFVQRLISPFGYAQGKSAEVKLNEKGWWLKNCGQVLGRKLRHQDKEK